MLDLVEGDTGAFRSRLAFPPPRPSCPHTPATLSGRERSGMVGL